MRWTNGFTAMKRRRSSCCTNKKKPKVHLSSIDIYSYHPIYDYTSYASWFGVICSIITIGVIIGYIGITTRDFATEPPELVKQGTYNLPKKSNPGYSTFTAPQIGIEIAYPLEDEYQVINAQNLDPYFRFQFLAITKENQGATEVNEQMLVEECNLGFQNKRVVCTKESERDKTSLEGTFDLPVYKYVKVQIMMCNKEQHEGCAPYEDVRAIVDAGKVEIILWITSQNFDAMNYHQNNKSRSSGVVDHHLSWRFFAVPKMELLMETFMEGRNIKLEERFIGSPPFKERSVNILSFHNIANYFRVTQESNPDLMSFYVRLHPEISVEEVAYWLRSILDLFSMWGAMASFLSTLSLGYFARLYNHWKFCEKFKHSTSEITKNAQMNYYGPESFTLTDIRLFNVQDFSNSGKLNIRAEEFFFPSSPYGEMRRIAVLEHFRKREAAEKISSWYLRHLIRCNKTVLSVERQMLINNKTKKRRLGSFELVAEKLLERRRTLKELKSSISMKRHADVYKVKSESEEDMI